MKKFLEILKYAPCFALSLMLMTSCDKEADKLEIETRTLNYSGTFYMYLYSTDMALDSESIFNLDIDAVPGNIKIDVSNEGYAIVDFVPGREIRLATPFFERVTNAEGDDYARDDKGNYIYSTIPMDIYENSPILKLYNAVNDDVNVTDDEKNELRKLLCEIEDTITISPFTTSRIPLIQQGATIVSYDFEQNSFFSSFTLGDLAYSHKSSLTKTIKYIEDNLLSKMASGKDAATNAIQTIRAINSSATGKMTNAWGRLTLQYMNNYCDYDMRIESDKERPNEMLVNISKVLYGEDKNLWFLIEYTGHMGDSSWEWVEQKEE